MNIFISWSKPISLQYATLLKELLETIHNDISVFVSESDIYAGEEVQRKIIDRLHGCDKLILCFTKENKKSPWLLFEAGYAKGLNKTVIPFLFDEDTNWHSWIDNPMNLVRELSINSFSMDDFINGFELSDTIDIRQKISDFRTKISGIKEKNRLVDAQCEDFIDKLMSTNAFTIENPIFRHRTAYFFTGFESFDLYKSIVDSFLYTGKYLWIYGRKNMKLFGGNFKELFQYLDEKSYSHSNMDGIDFRCMFLDPNSEEVKRAHKQQDIFRTELITTLYRARDVIGDNKILEKCFKLYSNKREAIIIRIDNCIIYSRPMFDANGVPQLLTDTKFEVFSSDSERGRECIQKFEDVWNNARNMYYSF